jgi:hypothetical protein
VAGGFHVHTPAPTDDDVHVGSRKLACSKEPDGCARCKREGIVCHYSPQKQMGRPRKRPRDEPSDATMADDVATESANKNPMMDLPPDTMDPGMEFINMLTSGDLNFDWANPALLSDGLDAGQHQLRIAQPPAEKANDNSNSNSNSNDWSSFGFTGNDFGQLNFDSAGVEPTPTFSNLDIDPALFGSGDPTTSTATSIAASSETPAVPALESTGATNTPSSTNGSPGSYGEATTSTPGPARCSCTSNLFNAIDSMRSLPDEVGAAVRQARLASKTAYEVVNCPSCSVPPTLPPPMQPYGIPPTDGAKHNRIVSSSQAVHGFQTLMLLATLIPSVVSAYERIVHMVDQTASRAASERRELAFTLPGYGGIWGPMATNDGCGASSALSHRMMEPTMWRLTVRALLRVDVYGISGSCGPDGSSSAQADPFHLGLRDIVNMMENRSRNRHAVIDPLIESGMWDDVQCSLKMHKTGEKPTCLKIIQIAKTAVDNLVIA